MNIPDALRTASREAGWTATKVAAAADVSESTVRNWMTGRTSIPGEKLLALGRIIPGLRPIIEREMRARVA